MTGEELKQALINKKPVIFTRVNGDRLEYAYVSGIIYRIKNERVSVSAELMDKSLHSVTIVSPSQVSYLNKEE